jgi:hypothetical protein
MAGQLRVDEITNEAGTGSPSFPNGLAASTATTAGSITGTTTAAVPTSALGSGTASGTTFLAGDRSFKAVPTDPTITITNTQIFTASGTWTKPTADANDTLIVACIGGGASGGATRIVPGNNGSASGGGGGGVALFSVRIGDLPATVSVTVGSGGASVIATSNNEQLVGNAGGDSVFNNYARAKGGAGGVSNNAAAACQGGAGALSLSFLGNTSIDMTGSPQTGGSGRSTLTTLTATSIIPYGLTGGGGAFIRNASTDRTQNAVGGIDRLFGDGGVGANPTAGNGVIPGGGGGGAVAPGVNATSGAGARGEVRCYVVKGRVSAAAFFGTLAG